MEELLKVIALQWDADGGAEVRDLATGGLWLAEAPQGTTGPYVVYHHLSGTVDDTTTSKLELPVIQFSIFATDEDGAQTAVKIRDALVVCYDDVLLHMDNDETMWRATRLGSGHLVKEPDEGWALHLEYEFGYG